jgi:23S rRNA pseudouridine2605 synthase
MTTVRLQKILARGGLASRRHAEELITAGRVRVNGKVVSELGSKADPVKDKIEVDGKRVMAESFVYVVLHKPRGVVATLSDPEGRPTVRDALKNVPGRVYPVGRLDFATSGVLLVTNDGEFSDGLLHPRKAVPKTYVVKSTGEMTDKDLDRWRKGLRLEDGMTLPADVRFIRHEGGKTWFELTIREGRNQQIRRMGEASGFPVMRLARLSFAGVTSEDLRPGDWRYLTREELVALRTEYGVPKRIPTMPSAKAPTRSKRPARPERARPESAAKPQAKKTPTVGPRYGGGSPGRRSYDVQEDWGGGAGRGRSSGRYADVPPDRPSRGGQSSRAGVSRTTGSGGGIGASEGDYRISRTRRGR